MTPEAIAAEVAVLGAQVSDVQVFHHFGCTVVRCEINGHRVAGMWPGALAYFRDCLREMEGREAPWLTAR